MIHIHFRNITLSAQTHQNAGERKQKVSQGGAVWVGQLGHGGDKENFPSCWPGWVAKTLLEMQADLQIHCVIVCGISDTFLSSSNHIALGIFGIWGKAFKPEKLEPESKYLQLAPKSFQEAAIATEWNSFANLLQILWN